MKEGGRRDRELVARAREAPAGEEALVALGCPAVSRSCFAVVGLRLGERAGTFPRCQVLPSNGLGGRGETENRGSRGKDSDRDAVASSDGYNNTY